MIVELCRLNRSFLAKIVFYPKIYFTILYCCLLIIASIFTMFSFQGAFELQRNSMKFLFQGTSVNFFKVVEISGIEPLTSCLQGRRSPSWAKPPYLFPFVEVVGQNGLEPSTSRLSVVCSSQLSYWPIRLLFGGEYRDRTGDLLLARQALSQLS